MREILRHAGRTGLLCALAATTGAEGSCVVDEVIGEATEAEPIACDSALATAVCAVSVSRFRRCKSVRVRGRLNSTFWSEKESAFQRRRINRLQPLVRDGFWRGPAWLDRPSRLLHLGDLWPGLPGLPRRVGNPAIRVAPLELLGDSTRVSFPPAVIL